MMMPSAFALLLPVLILSSIFFEASGKVVRTPPRGWNSYDSFSWIVDEEAFLDNAQVVSNRMLSFGYEYVVIDYLWYRRRSAGATFDPYGFDILDKWGRLVPDPDRWPSSKYGNGFKEVAQKVHDMGLKFGIHLMRGISLQAVNTKKPILDVTTGLPYVENGRTWLTSDIGMREKACGWMKNGFMSVNTDLGAGRAFLRSLYQQYADWDVDFVKVDCIFGDDLDKKEIVTVSEILQSLNRPVIYSLSPGTNVAPSMAEGISEYVDLYRITGDTWDNWADIENHFDVARDFAGAKKIGANGLHGSSWPDLDMLPFGWLTNPGAPQGPHRTSRLTRNEQRSVFTLWSMAKSPLMYGGDLRQIDDFTFNLITNPTLLEINLNSKNNMELCSSSGHGTLDSRYSTFCTTMQAGKNSKYSSRFRTWIATGVNGEIYLSIFNMNPSSTTATANIKHLAKVLDNKFMGNSSCNTHEIWTGKGYGRVEETVSILVKAHGCAVFVMNCDQ